MTRFLRLVGEHLVRTAGLPFSRLCLSPLLCLFSPSLSLRRLLWFVLFVFGSAVGFCSDVFAPFPSGLGIFVLWPFLCLTPVFRRFSSFSGVVLGLLPGYAVSILCIPWMVRGLGLMLRLKFGFVSMFSFLHETKGGWLPWIFFTVSFGDCWFILLGNHAITSLAASLIELWRFLSGSWWRSLFPCPLTAHSRLESSTLFTLLPVCGQIPPCGLVPS